MKLKFYLLSVVVAIFTLQSAAQSTQIQKKEAEINYYPNFEKSEFHRQKKLNYSTDGAKNTIYSNEFDDPSDWTFTNEGEEGTFALVDNGTSGLAPYIFGDFFSETADNGYAEFDGIVHLISADNTVLQDSYIELNDAIDCSSLADVAVTFTQNIYAFNVDEQYLQISIDGGVSWVPYLLNDDVGTNDPPIQGELTVDITDVAAGESDVRIRFRHVADYFAAFPDNTQEQANMFGGSYGWRIDDLVVASVPVNELIVDETYYQDFFETAWLEGNTSVFASDETSDLDIVSSFEYRSQPAYSTVPFNFACEVTNGGTAEQTGVSMVVTFTDPDGGVNTTPLVSDPITLAPGESDTLRLYGSVPSNWSVNGEGDLPIGTYFMDFEVVQDQDDEFPGNNSGVSRFTIVNDAASETGGVISHENIITGTNPDGQDVIQGNRYTFSEGDENRFISSIRFAMDDLSINGVGEQVFFNVRTGSLLDEETEENPINLLFSYEDGDENAIIYEVAEEDLSEGNVPNWITIDLPSPVLIEPGLIYQAEMRVPVFGEPLVYIGFTGSREIFTSLFLDLSDGDDAGWGFYGAFSYLIAFGTEEVLNAPEISYESGIKLVQNYPNPVVDNTMIQYQLDETSAVTFEVFDITGKLVHSEDLGNVPALTNQIIDFNRAGLASGTYTYGVVTETERLTRKMIIQ